MAIGDRVDDRAMGQWFIHRAFRLNFAQQTAFGKTYLSHGDMSVTQTVSILCVDK